MVVFAVYEDNQVKISIFSNDLEAVGEMLSDLAAEHEMVESVLEAELCVMRVEDAANYTLAGSKAWSVVVADRSAEESATHAMNMGIHDYVLKPITAAKIRRICKQAERWKQKADQCGCLNVDDQGFRQRAEVALWRSEQKYLNLFRYTNDAIVIVDIKSRKVADCNHRMLALTGYSRREMIGLSASKLQNSEMMKESISTIRKIIRKGSGTLENILMDKDGRQTPVVVHANEILFAGKRAFQFMVRDISDQKRAEEALRTSEWRLRSILDHSPIAICLKDLNGRYLLANRRYETLSNFNNSPFIGKNDFDLFPQKLVDAFNRHEQQVVAMNIALTFEEEVVLDGKTRVFNSLKFPLEDEEGSVYAVCGMLTDITERKRATKAIERLNRENRSLAQASLQARERERTLIARELHDELGQTLTMIRNELHRLSEQSKGRQTLMDSVQFLDTATEKMIGITRSMLQRLQPPLLKEVPLCDALNAQVRSWENQQDDVQCALKANVAINALDQDMKLMVYRIIQEALTNISKHAEASTVIISITIDVDGGEKRLRLSIDDDGKGMDLADIGQSGLGLIGMRERVAAADGQFSIESYPNGGTTVVAEVKL